MRSDFAEQLDYHIAQLKSAFGLSAVVFILAFSLFLLLSRDQGPCLWVSNELLVILDLFESQHSVEQERIHVSDQEVAELMEVFVVLLAFVQELLSVGLV